MRCLYYEPPPTTTCAWETSRMRDTASNSSCRRLRLNGREQLTHNVVRIQVLRFNDQGGCRVLGRALVGGCWWSNELQASRNVLYVFCAKSALREGQEVMRIRMLCLRGEKVSTALNPAHCFVFICGFSSYIASHGRVCLRITRHFLVDITGALHPPSLIGSLVLQPRQILMQYNRRWELPTPGQASIRECVAVRVVERTDSELRWLLKSFPTRIRNSISRSSYRGHVKFDADPGSSSGCQGQNRNSCKAVGCFGASCPGEMTLWPRT